MWILFLLTSKAQGTRGCLIRMFLKCIARFSKRGNDKRLGLSLCKPLRREKRESENAGGFRMTVVRKETARERIKNWKRCERRKEGEEEREKDRGLKRDTLPACFCVITNTGPMERWNSCTVQSRMGPTCTLIYLDKQLISVAILRTSVRPFSKLLARSQLLSSGSWTFSHHSHLIVYSCIIVWQGRERNENSDNAAYWA